MLFEGYSLPESNHIVVGDADTHEIIASYMLPKSLRATVHTTMTSPDGRYVYIIGARGDGVDDMEVANGLARLEASATLLKVDAVTLQPVDADQHRWPTPSRANIQGLSAAGYVRPGPGRACADVA